MLQWTLSTLRFTINHTKFIGSMLFFVMHVLSAGHTDFTKGGIRIPCYNTSTGAVIFHFKPNISSCFGDSSIDTLVIECYSYSGITHKKTLISSTFCEKNRTKYKQTYESLDSSPDSYYYLSGYIKDKTGKKMRIALSEILDYQLLDTSVTTIKKLREEGFSYTPFNMTSSRNFLSPTLIAKVVIGLGIAATTCMLGVLLCKPSIITNNGAFISSTHAINNDATPEQQPPISIKTTEGSSTTAVANALPSLRKKSVTFSLDTPDTSQAKQKNKIRKGGDRTAISFTLPSALEERLIFLKDDMRDVIEICEKYKVEDRGGGRVSYDSDLQDYGSSVVKRFEATDSVIEKISENTIKKSCHADPELQQLYDEYVNYRTLIGGKKSYSDFSVEDTIAIHREKSDAERACQANNRCKKNNSQMYNEDCTTCKSYQTWYEVNYS